MTLTPGSSGLARLAGEAGTCKTVLCSFCTPAGSTSACVLSCDMRRPWGCTLFAGAMGCGLTRTWGSGGSVTTGAAEVSPRCVGTVAGALEDVGSAVFWSWSRSWSRVEISRAMSALVRLLGCGR